MEIENAHSCPSPRPETDHLNDTKTKALKGPTEVLPSSNAQKTFQRKSKGGFWIYVPHKGFTPYALHYSDPQGSSPVRLWKPRKFKSVEKIKTGSPSIKSRGLSISDLTEKIAAQSFSKCLRIKMIMNNICAIKKIEEQNWNSLQRLCRKVGRKFGCTLNGVDLLHGVHDVLTKNSQQSTGILRGMDKVVQDIRSIQRHDVFVSSHFRTRNIKHRTKGLSSLAVQKIRSNFLSKIRSKKNRTK